VLSHAEIFRRTSVASRLGRHLFGDGVLVVEGAQHRAQRRVMNPAFGPVQVRELSGIFLDKANEVGVILVSPPSSQTAGQLRDVWASKLRAAGGTRLRLDIADGLSAATLDIIGLAGFGYTFDALARPADDPSELSAAMGTFVGRGRSSSLSFLFALLPGAQYLPTRAARGQRWARAIMEHIGRELIQERKAAAM
jgi:cytochrome P450